MRFLAIDLGAKRTGLAAGDDVTSLISPVDVLQIPIGEQLRDALLKAIERHAPDAVVIGLPLNMDGTEGPQAKVIRTFGDTLAARITQPIHFQDERLTSYAAEQHLNQSGRTHGQKKKLRDALAAAEILRDFLEQRLTCPQCSYDLRGGSRDCIQCPECGRVIEIETRRLLTGRGFSDE